MATPTTKTPEEIVAEQTSPITPEQTAVQEQLQIKAGIPQKVDPGLTQEAFTGNVATELAKMQQGASAPSSVTSTPAQNQLNQAQQEIEATKASLPGSDVGKQMISLDGGNTFVEATEANLIKQSQQEATKPYTELQDARAKQLQAQKDAIENQTRQLLAGTEQQQKSSRAASAMQLARMGALGTSLSGVSYLQNLEASQQAELNNLVMKSRQLISEAESAFAEGNADVAIKKSEAARQAKEDFFRKDQERLDTLMKAQKLETDWGRYEMEQQDFFQKAERNKLENTERLASSLAASLIDLSDAGEIVESPTSEVVQLAAESNIDPNVLLAKVKERADSLRKMGLDERKFVHTRAMDQLQTQLAEEKFGLDKLKFEFDKYQTEFNQDVKLRELSYKERESKAEDLGLSGSQLSDAVKKGYTTEAQLRLYAAQAEKGIDPPAIKEKSAETKKMEGNILSGLSAISLIRKSVKDSVGRGKFLNPTYKAAEDNLVDIIGRLRSGGAITEDESKRFERLLPGFWQSDETRLSKLKELENNLINTIGKDNYKQSQKEMYADMTTFRQFAPIEDKDDFDKFLKVMAPSPDEDITEYFELFKKHKDFNQPLSKGEKGLGSLSARFESSGDPGTIGRDRTGGWSYGTYQLAHNNAKRFIEQSEFSDEFEGIPFNSVAFRNKWKEVAKSEPEAFKNAQHDFIRSTHLEPQKSLLSSKGLDITKYSPALEEVIMSVAVQHGPKTDVISKALNKVGKNASEEALIRAIFDERWSGGKRFARSSPDVKRGVYNRFFGKNGELEQALKMIS